MNGSYPRPTNRYCSGNRTAQYAKNAVIPDVVHPKLAQRIRILKERTVAAMANTMARTPSRIATTVLLLRQLHPHAGSSRSYASGQLLQ